jgi:hypothetical protein
MEGLSFDNVMSAEDIFSLFNDEDTPKSKESKEIDNDEDNNITEELGNPFEDDSAPESVGDDQEGSEVQTQKKSSSSPNNFSSIASTLKELGTFEDLSDDDISKISDAQGLLDAIEK